MSRHKISCAIAACGLILAACGGTTAENTTTDAPAATPAPSTTTSTEAPATTVAPTTQAAPTTEAATTEAPVAVNAQTAAFQRAVEETVEVNSAQMEGRFVVTGAEGFPAGQPVTMSFSGAFDNTSGEFAISIDLGDMMEAAGAAGEEIPPEFAELFSDLEMRQIGDTAYVRFGFFNMFLGVETDWLSMPAEASDDGVGDFTGGVVPTNPTEFFEAFDGVNATVEEVGRDTVRGANTTRYRVTVDTAALAEAGDTETLEALELQGPVPLDELVVDFWVSDDGLMHRFEMDIDGDDVVAEPGDDFEAMTITFEIWGYNEPIEVTPPDPAEVTNIDDIDMSGLFGEF